MQAYDLHSKLNVLNALTAVNIGSNTTTVGEIIDTKGVESILFAIKAETLVDGDYAVQVFVGDAANMSDEVLVTKDLDLPDTLEADAIAFVLTDDDTVKKIGAVSGKRYARAKIVSTNVTTGGDFSAIAILGNLKSKR